MIFKKEITWLNKESGRVTRKNRANLLSQVALRKLRTRYADASREKEIKMEISEFIQSKMELMKKVQSKKTSLNEAQTKEWLIRPFFECLGWDFSSPEDVIPEDDDNSGKKPDYGFYIEGKAQFFVEAKPLGFNIDDIKVVTEKLNYCNNANVPFLIITNGNDYRIYYIGLKGANVEKLLTSFSIFDSYDEEVITKITKEAIKCNTLEKYAKTISIYSTVKKSFEIVIQQGSKKMIDLINEQIKNELGYKVGDDDIKNALQHFVIELSEEDFEEEANTEKTTVINGKQANYDEEHQFNNGKWNHSSDLYNRLKKKLEQEGVQYSNNATDLYISFTNNKKNFMQIHGQQKGLKAWIDIPFAEISESDKLKVRDVTNIGHWGMSNTECVIRNENDFDWFIPLIKKVYEKTKNA